MFGPSVALAKEMRVIEQEIKTLEDKRMKLTQELQLLEPIGYLPNVRHSSIILRLDTNKQRREMYGAFVSKMEFDPDVRKIDGYLWSSPLLGPDNNIKKSKHIFCASTGLNQMVEAALVESAF